MFMAIAFDCEHLVIFQKSVVFPTQNTGALVPGKYLIWYTYWGRC